VWLVVWFVLMGAGFGRHGGPLCRRGPARWDYVPAAGRPQPWAAVAGTGGVRDERDE